MLPVFFFRNLVEINFFSQFGIIWQKSLEIPLFFCSFFKKKNKNYLFIYVSGMEISCFRYLSG
jgi:hypothetical protein